MSDQTSSHDYSGDVSLTGSEEAPIQITQPENVHIEEDSINGDLIIKNAEWVHTNTQPASEESTVESVETEISGTIEDGYIEQNTVDGDVIIANAEDVFIEDDAVSGSLYIVGAEDTFHDSSDKKPPNINDFDDSVSGWKRSLNIDDPNTGVRVIGGKNEAKVRRSTDDIHIYITGWNNTVRIDGKKNSVFVHFIGSENTVEVGAYTNATIVTDSGRDNEIVQDSFPVEDLINTSKSEAYNNAFIGRKKITYQEPATTEEYCPNCGATADAIIERHQEDAFFFFSYPFYHFETTSASYECEECSTRAQPDVELSEEERKQIL